MGRASAMSAARAAAMVPGKFRCDGLVEESGLGGGAAGGDFAEAGGGDSNVGDAVVFDQGEAGQGDFGDGLGVASADLADVRAVAGELARESDGVEEFVGGEGGLL